MSVCCTYLTNSFSFYECHGSAASNLVPIFGSSILLCEVMFDGCVD